MYNACSRVVVMCSALYAGSAKGGVGPSGFGVWEGPEDHILMVMGYVFFSPRGKDHGAAVYDSFDF
jgi:hypothetical protein